MEENILEFVKKHFWKFALSVLSLLLILLLFQKQLSFKQSDAKKDFAFILDAASKMKKGEPLSNESLEKAEIVVKNHPELHPAYDEILGLSFLESHETEKASSYLQNALKAREKILPPCYQAYGKITLMLAQDKFEEAYLESKKLDELLVKDPSFSKLYGFNLLRLTFLAKMLNDEEMKNGAFSRLEKLPIYNEIAPLFKEGNFTIKDFLAL